MATTIPVEGVEPETPVAAEHQDDGEKITFDEKQQAKVEELIKKASRTAGAAARTEAARLQKELDTLRAKAGDVDPTLALAEAKAEIASMKAEREQSTIQSALMQAAAQANFIDPQLAADLLARSIRVIDGKPVVIDATGAPRLNSQLEPMTPAEAAQELAQQKRFLIKGDVRGGSGSVPSLSPASGIRLQDLFGAQSDGGKANELAMRNPTLYKSLKAQWRAKGGR